MIPAVNGNTTGTKEVLYEREKRILSIRQYVGFSKHIITQSKNVFIMILQFISRIVAIGEKM